VSVTLKHGQRKLIDRFRGDAEIRCAAATTTATTTTTTSIQFFIIYVLSQQPHGQLQTAECR
jgi:hypothetical protein